MSAQNITPPTIKISSNYPFHLLALDLIQFPTTTGGNVAALMAVDHFSKFLVSVPLHNKKAETVVTALSNHVLPRLVRIPTRILTDNGPEFISEHFNDLMSQYSIEHNYSTRYRAQGNGAVERVNRTMTEFLKGLREHGSSWDVNLSRAVVVYNNTLHRELGTTPSSCILSSAHVCEDRVPIDSSIVDTWREGHPAFVPFSVGQKVALKINRIGRQLIHKLDRKYEGLYYVMKVQSNRVSYEVCLDGEGRGKVLKVHHKQLKSWSDPPGYLLSYLKMIETDTGVQKVDSVDVRSAESDDSDSSDGWFMFGCSDGESSECESFTTSTCSDKSSVDRDNLVDDSSSSDTMYTISSESDSSSVSESSSTECVVIEHHSDRDKDENNVKLSSESQKMIDDIKNGCHEHSEQFNSENKRRRRNARLQSTAADENFSPFTIEDFSEVVNSQSGSEMQQCIVSDSFKLVGEIVEAMRTSLQQQELLVSSLEKVISTSHSDGKKENIVPGYLDTENTFSGIGENEIHPTSAKLEVLKIMESQLHQIEDVTSERQKKNIEKKNILRKNIPLEESFYTADNKSSESSDSKEVSLPKIELRRSPIRTRSRGPVPDLPNVMPKRI